MTPATAPNHAATSLDESLALWRDALSARCKPGSVARMVGIAERVGRAAGWTTAQDVDYAGAVAFLAARRRDGWSGPTHDQTVSVLRNFGEFLRRSGFTASNPLADLEACGEPGEAGTRALTLIEARRLIACSIDRHLSSRRAKGCAPLFWLHQILTGLRYAEARSAKWQDYALDAPIPAIYTDPRWTGNKGRRRDVIPLHPELAAMLRDYRRTVPSGPTDPVFPIAPTRATFRADRDDARIPALDERRRPVAIHSLRKTFATLLDAAGATAGEQAILARHAQTLTQRTYTDHDLERLARIVGRIPPVWAVGVQIVSIRATKKLAPAP